MKGAFAYEFGDVRVDLARMSVTRGGAPIPLEPKGFDVLVFLIEHRDRLVGKDELLDAVWPGTFVTPNVLTRAIAQIRKALGDESQDARYIETVAKRGYRFIPAVTTVPSPAANGERPARDDRLPRQWSSRIPRWLRWVAIVSIPIGAGVALVLLDRPAPPDAASADVQLRRLTTRRGYNGTPALSPDGRAIVYASDKTGSLELYVASPIDGSPEVALTNDGGQNVQPAWSSDGQWIAFHSRRRGGIWVVPSIGGAPQQVIEFGSDPAWSPDGSTIVFASDAGGPAQSSLWTVRRDGGARRPLTAIGKPLGGHRSPAWSHDGRHIAFIVATARWTQEIWTVDAASAEMQMIARTLRAADPAFAPDDRAIYWGGTTETGNGRLYRHALDADAKPIGKDEIVVPTDGNVVDGISLASNGTLAFSIGSLDDNLWAVEVKADGRGGEAVRLTDDVARNTYPDYSYDGRVAFTQLSVGSPPSVWIMREDGSARNALVAGTGASNPQWMSDGSRLMIVREARPGDWEFVWVDVASRRMTPAGLHARDMLSPRVSRDGRTVAFHVLEADGRMSVWTAGFDGTRAKIASDPEAVSYPVWSPDGQSLAVEIKRGDSTHIGVVPRGGGPVEQLTSDRGQSWPQSWAPDNDRIAFAGQRNGVWNVYSVSRRTRAVVQITSFTTSTGFVRHPSWSPAGSRIVFERALESASVWTMALPRSVE